MTAKIPLKVIATGSDATGLSEFVAADYVSIADGGTGAITAAAALTALGAVPIAGGTMTGSLVLDADPSAALGAATKQYADAAYSHPNHSGDVTSTGDGATVITSAAITGKTLAVGTSGDFLLISDTSDAGNIKKMSIDDVLGGGGGETINVEVLTGGNKTLTNTDDVVQILDPTTNRDVTLPAEEAGLKFTIKNNEPDDTAWSLTVKNDAAATIVALKPRQIATFISDGTSWYMSSPPQLSEGGNVVFGANTYAFGNASVAFGEATGVAGNASVGIGGTTNVSGATSVGVGCSASVAWNNGTVVGYNATVTGHYGTALGKQASAGNEAISIGLSSDANGVESIAIGQLAQATVDSTIAIGANTSVDGIGSIAIGTSAIADGSDSIVMGHLATATTFTDVVVIGDGAASAGNDAVTLGSASGAGVQSIAIGSLSSSGISGIAIGHGATADGADSVVIGPAANATTFTGVTVIGDTASATKNGSIALGSNSNTTRVNELAINSDSATDDDFYRGSIGILNTTASVTPTELLCGGVAAERITIKADSIFTFIAIINGRDNTTGNCCAYKFEGSIKRDALNATTLVGTPLKAILGEDLAGFDCNVTADDTNEALVFTVTAAAVNSTQWSGNVDFTETKF